MQVRMKLALLFLISLCVSTYDMASISEGDGDDRDLERQVRMMNKSPMKTFVTKEGETIDCVEIDKQPALDHPQLKNHKIQIEPNLSFVPFHGPSKVKFVQFESREPCPLGTVPIRRVRKEDLTRAKSVAKMPSSNSPNTLSQHVVSLRDEMTENIKYGGCGVISVYNLTVSHDQGSSHNMWIETGPPNHINMIVAGWQVFPQLYGDSRPRLFTYWTGNGQRNGCYNMLCPGFVQVHRSITPGHLIDASSIYGGPQIVVSIQIHQDASTRNWWLTVGHQIIIGYWPSELFSYLRNGSLHTAWGGVGMAGRDGVCPPMGSGHKPDGDFKHATYFRALHWIDATAGFQGLSKRTVKWVDKSNVYNLKYYGDRGRRDGYCISFGGPGGYCDGGMHG